MAAGVGAKIGQYVLLREIGAGGMGRVFEASHVELGKRVAVKLLHQNLVASPAAVRRFLREGRACSRIQHPHVIEVWDVGVRENQPYLVMELVDGIDLASLLRDKHTLGLGELAEIFLPLCSAIWTAHQSGVVHRDLKPANVLLTYPRPNAVHPVIVDFGVSKLLFSDAADDLTKTGSQIGTAAYMAPEQTSGPPCADPASDQYALGVMLYECATGCRPFHGESHYDLMHAIRTAAIVPPSQHNPNVPPELERVVLRAMSRNPAQRYPSVYALGAALLSLAGARGWALWGSEFCGTEAKTGGTDVDRTRSNNAGVRSKRPGGSTASAVLVPLWLPPRKWGAAALLTAALGASIVFAIIDLRSPASGERESSPVSTTPAGHPRSESTALAAARSTSVSEPVTKQAATPISAPQSMPAAAPTRKVASASRRNTTDSSHAAQPAGSAERGISAGAARASSSAELSRRAPSVQRCTNGVFIVE
jgi:serine/threonine protein kinase